MCSALVQSPRARTCRNTVSWLGCEERLKGCHSNRETAGMQMKQYWPPEYWKSWVGRGRGGGVGGGGSYGCHMAGMQMKQYCPPEYWKSWVGRGRGGRSEGGITWGHMGSNGVAKT